MDAAELAELLLALARGFDADPSDPDAPRRRLRTGVALLVAGVDHPLPDQRTLSRETA